MMVKKSFNLSMSVALCILAMGITGQVDAYADDASNTAINVGEVEGTAASKAETIYKKKTRPLHQTLTNKQVFESTQSVVTLTTDNKKMISPNAGAAELLGTAPGVHIMSENPQNGSGRYNITINGMGIGWWSGNTYRNQISVLFDGIPMNNQITNDGQWNSSQIPILTMIHGVNVVYGPGNPQDRWYDSMGGTINFVPLQPTQKSNAKVNLSFGSYGSKTASFSVNTGDFYGWSTVLAGGYTSANSFFTGSSNWPQHSWSVYMKTAHPFSNGLFTLGFYYEKSDATHSLTVPVTPIAGYSVNGYGKPGTLLSQQTSGFYYVPSADLWYKDDIVDSWILYSQQLFDLGGGWTLKNTPWYRHAYRLHQAYFNYGATNYNPEAAEHYAPTNNSFGDRLDVKLHSHYNDVALGGWLSYQQYNTNEDLWNPYLGTSQNNPYVYNNVEINSLFSDLFAQDTVKLDNGNLRITPGLALAGFYTSMSDLINPNTSAAYLTATPGAKTNFTRLEPSLGINYKVINNVSLYANYSETYQNETDLAYGAYLQKIKINPADIPITKAQDYEVGVRYHNQHLNAGVNYYHDYLTNLLNGVSGSITQFNASGYNLGNAVYQGVNVFVKWKPVWKLYVYGSANVQHSYYTSDYNNSGQSFNGLRLAGIPHYSFNASVSYKFVVPGGIFEPTLTDQYSGGQTLYDNVTGGPTDQTINAYNLVNLSANYETTDFNRLIPGVKETSFTFGLYNLLNRKYESDIYLATGGYDPAEQPSLFAYAGAPLQIFGGISVKF
ncbi:MAG: TonB-dependent receptor [Candidatus Igneacidithiobacillus chanchocoensis]